MKRYLEGDSKGLPSLFCISELIFTTVITFEGNILLICYSYWFMIARDFLKKVKLMGVLLLILKGDFSLTIRYWVVSSFVSCRCPHARTHLLIG